MGVSLSWIAMKGVPLAEAALAFGLVQSGASEVFMDFAIGGTQSADWAIIIVDDVYPKLADERELLRLSTGGDIIVVHVNETTMLQWASRWRDGANVWAVRHHGQVGVRHLEAEGYLPPEFSAMRAAAFARQDEADAAGESVDHVSDVPLELAAALTGFRHDVMLTSEVHELVPGGPR